MLFRTMSRVNCFMLRPSYEPGFVRAEQHAMEKYEHLSCRIGR
jgi:hypothetical protein